jgi:hypothetical protein
MKNGTAQAAKSGPHRGKEVEASIKHRNSFRF